VFSVPADPHATVMRHRPGVVFVPTRQVQETNPRTGRFE
jgi:hypothetical protein